MRLCAVINDELGVLIAPDDHFGRKDFLAICSSFFLDECTVVPSN